ncbi:unnamed protein product, partial [Hapterophycus canaliculatus]
HQYCANFCRDKGSDYFGTQYSYQCFCSASGAEPTLVKEEDTVCGDPCSGAADETCGGSYAMTVYKFDA